MNSTEEVLSKLDALIQELEKTSNSTLTYFYGLKKDLEAAASDEERDRIYDLLRGTRKIGQYGGFNPFQDHKLGEFLDATRKARSSS